MKTRKIIICIIYFVLIAFCVITYFNEIVGFLKKVVNFFASLGTAEVLITIALIAICVYIYFDCKKLDKRLDDDIKWFEKRYGHK